MSNLSNYIWKSPENVQSSAMSGIYKGIVTGVRDPMGMGRVRVHIYSLYGDYIGIDNDAIPWCEVLHSGRGEFATPEMFDRVVVSFEAGDKYHPIVVGYWRANPAGRGTLPYSVRVGSEVRPEAWHTHNLYPESNMLSCDGPGNAIWTEAKFMDGKSLQSSINLVDTGGKQVKVKSFHKSAQSYTPLQEVPSGQSLANMTLPACTPTRDGFSTENTTGSIELNQDNVSRVMQSAATDFSTDAMIQKGGIDQYNVDGTMHRTRQGNAMLSMFKDCLALNSPNAVFITNSFQAPRRWD